MAKLNRAQSFISLIAFTLLTGTFLPFFTMAKIFTAFLLYEHTDFYIS
jgi:hypothetical protein